MARARLVNAGLFQVTWFACVLGGASGSNLWGAAALLGMLAFSARGQTLRADLAMAALAAAVGFGLDTLWIHLGVLDYHGAAVAPLWIVLLWVAVALSLNHSLAMFQPRPLLGGLLAAACAPLSYLGGARLGGVIIPDPQLLAVIGGVWFVVFAVGFYAAARATRRREGVALVRRLPEEATP